MSRTHVIDDEPQLFHFDSCDESDLLHTSTMIPSLARVNLDALELAPQTFSHDAPSTSEETFDMGDVEVIGKGKGVTRTLPIRVPTAPAQDSFNMEYFASLPSTSTGSVLSSNLLTPLTPPYFDQYSYSIEPRQQLSSHLHENAWGPAVEPSTESLGSKGKQKELPPVLPPLAFSPTELSYAPSSPSPLRSFSSSGPSSYGSSILPLTRVTSNPESQGTTSAITLLSPTTSEAPPIAHAAHRPRSLSSISVRSTRSLTARSMSQLRSRLTLSTSSNLARKLLFKKPADTQVSQYRSTTVDDELFRTTGAPDLWRTGMKLDELDATISWLSDSQTTILKSPNPFFSHTSLRHKGRSHSSPFPLSALDIVPLSTPDIFVPIPLVVRNYFDEVLPRELRLNVFEALVALHEADHLRTVRQGRWSVSKASSSRNRWVGRDKGVRELVKFSRVSKSWQALAFDGQLWAGLDLHSFPDMVESLILRFTNNAGQCIRTIDISGNSQLSAAALLDMADHFCINASSDLDSLCYTQLTGINLQGCSALTTRSLHHLLFRSPFLQKLCVKGLKAVTNSTCNILSTYNSQLISLNVSRCMNMDASGIKNMSTASLNRGAHLQLKELRMSGLRNIDDEMMAALGKAAPFLEVLDLSYARQLHNSAVDAFVACEMGEDIDQKTILVSPRDLGRSDSNGFRIQRRVTRLRHLSLSYCLLLTDDACSNLRSSVPDLEFLELGGIGADIKDDGLIRLLDTAPYIRRLDLEDAIHITDAVLSALTPSTNVTQPPLADVAPEPGHALEQLNISFAANITNNALIALIRGCTRLKHIEADNTHINSTMLKEFVRTCHQRGMVNAKANVVDCRGVTDSTVKDLAGLTRPRWGWRAHEARKLSFLDSRDGNIDELKVGQDECDEKRVVLKSFYSWQTVDNVKVAREKRRKSRRGASTESGESEIDDGVGRPLRWWSPGGRRTPAISGRNSPLNIADMNSDGCRVM